jgi:hypothetical protein
LTNTNIAIEKFCAFIDYRKAFDSVDRLALWHKLLQNCVDGKTFKIIHNMYDNAKSCVRKGSQLSEFFYKLAYLQSQKPYDSQ